MEYGALVRDAWHTTWRNRYLWVLALFAGGTVGVGGNDGIRFRGGDGAGVRDVSDVGPFRAWRDGLWGPGGAPEQEQVQQAQRFFGSAAQWATEHVALLAAGAALLVVLALGLVVLGLIARGGMAEATVDLANGRDSSLRRMWRTGLRLVWRYAGLWLVLAGVAVLAAAFIAGLVAVGAGLAVVTGAPQLVLGIGAGVAIPLVVVAVAAGIALSVTVAFAERAIYAEDAGPIEALRAGWRTLRGNLGTSAVLWLINLAMTVGLGIVGAVIGVIVVALVGGGGVAIWSVAGWTAPLFAYGALGLAALLAVVLTVVAVSNTFFWNYWTLAYLRLSGRAAA